MEKEGTRKTKDSKEQGKGEREEGRVTTDRELTYYLYNFLSEKRFWV